VPESLAASVAAGEGVGDARPDVVLVLGGERVSIVCTPRIRVPDAMGVDVIAPARHCPAIGTSHEVSLPPVPAVAQPIDALVRVLTELGVSEGATIALAPTRDAPAQWIACARASLARAGLSTTTLALRRPDGTFATMPFAWAPLDQTAFAMIVHVRPGGYAITRGHAHTVQLPRVRGASGLSFDRDALASAVGTRALQPVALDATSSGSALELVQAARVVAASGALALLRE
jgi:hypothetical protein